MHTIAARWWDGSAGYEHAQRTRTTPWRVHTGGILVRFCSKTELLLKSRSNFRSIFTYVFCLKMDFFGAGRVLIRRLVRTSSCSSLRWCHMIGRSGWRNVASGLCSSSGEWSGPHYRIVLTDNFLSVAFRWRFADVLFVFGHQFCLFVASVAVELP